MTFKYLLLFIISIALLISACKPGNDNPPPEKKSDFSSEDYQRSIQDMFNNVDSSIVNDSSHIDYFDTLKSFYSARNYQPLFIKDFENISSINPVLGLFLKAGDHGIDPVAYHLSLIKNELTKTSGSSPDKYSHLAIAELLFADAVLKYSVHLRYGVVNPAKIFSESYTLPVVDTSKRDIFKPLNVGDVFEYLKELQPKNPQYKKLQNALQYFNNISDTVWRPIKNISQSTLIKGKLSSLGFLDTSEIKTPVTKNDSVFIKSVVNFQIANGMNGDGKLDQPTIDKLNIPRSEYIEKIKLSMERMRWSNYSDTARYILVNIPDFRLHVIENGQEQFEIKVCTGKKRPANYYDRLKAYQKTHRFKPDDWETPQLFSEISHLVLNPTWTVPASIIKEEIFRESVKDSNYLKSKNFKVFRNGKPVNIDKVDLRKYSPNKIPFTFVQDPGAGNALGKIKFMFHNKYGVYLHDTPTRGPFARSNRAVSHGCIRVEKPFLLAEYLLRNNSKWTLDYIKIETGFAVPDQTKIAEFKQIRGELRKNASIGKTTEVKFDHRIPVVIDYYTAWVNDKGIMNFRNDVYGKDKILKKYLLLSGAM
jgi:L,D-transpeptidase YcbB